MCYAVKSAVFLKKQFFICGVQGAQTLVVKPDCSESLHFFSGAYNGKQGQKPPRPLNVHFPILNHKRI